MGWILTLKFEMSLPMEMLCRPFHLLRRIRSRHLLQKERQRQVWRECRLQREHQKLAEEAYRLKMEHQMKAVQVYRMLEQANW